MTVEKLLTPREASEILGVPVQTLAHWRTTRLVQVPYFKIGGKHVRYRASELAAWIDAQKVA